MHGVRAEIPLSRGESSGPIAAQGQVPACWTISRSSGGVDYVPSPGYKEERLPGESPGVESFYIAINEAGKTDRPVLLWAMNGHPLGCT